jgi:hypothetical protein
MNYLTNYYKNQCEQLQEKINHLEKLLNEGVVNPPFWSTAEAVKQFTTFPGTKKTIEVVSKPAETAKKVGETTKKAASYVKAHPVKSAGLAIGGAGILAAPLVLGYGVEAAADTGLEAAGMEKAEDGEMPGAREALSSAAGWGAMEGTSTVLSNILAQRALSAGLGTALGAGAVAGAVAPIVGYGAYRAGEKIGEVTGLHDFLRRQIGTDEVSATKEAIAAESPGFKSTEEYPSLEQIQAQTKAEREKTPEQVNYDNMTDEELRQHIKNINK